jgi:hypothetical protein
MVALLLGRRFERDGGSLKTEMSEPSLNDVGRYEI